MNTLPLPEQFRGSWDHALIMTYGLDVPFFERTLLPQFATRCRNKIILADGRHYLNASERYAQKESQIHHLNQSYIAAGIFGLRDAHAKVILLLNKEQGRLCIGSGNLNQQGYASGGELFTCYEYNTDSFEMLSAFLTIRELMDGLIRRNYLQGPVKRYIEYMWEDTPWLFRIPTGNSHPVRHNLTQSFLTQIEQTVNGEAVEELSILVPFFDKEATALAGLIDTLRPQHTTLLLQPGKASVDPDALQRVLDRIPGSYEVCPFQIKGEKAYVHAKCYVLKLANRAICLQGSPNLSQVALLLYGSSSNIEVANLLTGERTSFDHLFENLDIGAPVADLANLQLAYNPIEKADESPEDSWQLIGGEWDSYGLSLNFRGNLPDLQGAELVIGDKKFPLQVRNIEAQLLLLMLPPTAAELLTRPISVAISCSKGTEVYESNRIFVCNRTSLDAILHHSLADEKLRHTADLDLDDKEFEELLDELHQTLIVDERSIWELAGHPAPSGQKEDAEALHLNYDDINYDALRKHPKIRQYLESTLNEDRYTRSRLQIILSSITSHLDTLLQGDLPSATALMNSLATTVEEDEDEPIAEVSQAIEEAQKRSWTARRRIGQALKKFIRRYLHGYANPKFQEIVGFEVVTKNYIIFSQMLWQLFTKDWVEPSFIIDALIQSWDLFWGNWKPDGYFYTLDIDQQILAWHSIRKYGSDALTLASFFYCAQLATTEQCQKQLLPLRDSWRQFLCLSPFSLVPEVLSDAQLRLVPLFPYDPPTPATIVDQLTRLARFDTRANFLNQLEAPGRFPSGSCSFKKETLYIESLGSESTINCLLIQSPLALASKEAAITLLQAWIEAETLNYYRIAATKPGEPTFTTHVIYYDVAIKKGKYWDKASGNRAQQISGAIPLPKREWDATLAQLRTLAT